MKETDMMRISHPKGETRIVFLDKQYEVWDTTEGMETFVVRTNIYPRAKDAAMRVVSEREAESEQ